MRSQIIENYDGIFITFPNDAITQHITKNKKRWEPHFESVVKEFITPKDTVIDCGANFGYNSVIMGRALNNEGLLIAFEPQRIIYQQLNGNLILNNIYNCVSYNIGLGNKNIKTQLNYVNYEAEWVNIGDTSVGSGGEEITISKLDDFNFKNVNFIKIDVQGYELYLLQGAENTIATYKPTLFIEIEPHQLNKFNLNENDLINYIKSFGYRIFKINNEYPCDHICVVGDMDKIDNLRNILPIVEI